MPALRSNSPPGFEPFADVFVIPGAIGVQEGGFIALCGVFGIPAPTAIALSLIKRLPEIVLGIPGLLLWQGLEGRHLLRRRHDDAKSPVPLER